MHLSHFNKWPTKLRMGWSWALVADEPPEPEMTPTGEICPPDSLQTEQTAAGIEKRLPINLWLDFKAFTAPTYVLKLFDNETLAVYCELLDRRPL